MELEIDDLALFRELLALAAVAVAEDVLEPVSGTWFCLLARRQRPCVCLATARVSDGVATVSDAIEPTPPRERRRVDGAKVDNRHAAEPTPS